VMGEGLRVGESRCKLSPFPTTITVVTSKPFEFAMRCSHFLQIAIISRPAFNVECVLAFRLLHFVIGSK